jgi:hypothetical protein
VNRKKDEDDDDVVMLLRMDEEEVQSIVPIFTPPIVPLLEVKVVNQVNVNQVLYFKYVFTVTCIRVMTSDDIECRK